VKKIIRYLALALTVVFMSRCANVVTPAGGPKDEKPPVVLEASPANHSTNFKGKSIHLTFDEFITLNNASANVLISPPLKKKPTYRSSGKTVTIRFEEPLKPETTYSINFGEAIKDLHEGNVFKGYTYIFSTGETIDSLTLKGKVLSAETLKPSEGFYVGLYTTESDTVTLDYVTMTDKEGKFELSGLADKEYRFFVLKDGNSNLLYDLPNEEVGFYPEVVRPYYDKAVLKTDTLGLATDTTGVIATAPMIEKNLSYVILTNIEEDSIQKLFKKELVEAGLLRFVFRYPAENVSITTLEELPDTFNILQVYSARKDTVLWYFTPNKDSLWISINDGVNISDTTHISLKPRESVNKRRNKKKAEETPKYLTVGNNLKGGKLKPEQPLVLKFTEPVTRLNVHDTTWYIVDNDTVINKLNFIQADEYGYTFQLDKTLEPEKKYHIIFPDSTFFGFHGLTNDTTKISFSVQEESLFGNIYLTIEMPADVPQLIVELIDEKDKVIDRQIITHTQEVAFEYLEPAKYKLKAILDLDANQVWSPGNFKKKVIPEKVIFYDNVLEVRANWDIDLDEPWKIEK